MGGFALLTKCRCAQSCGATGASATGSQPGAGLDEQSRPILHRRRGQRERPISPSLTNQTRSDHERRDQDIVRGDEKYR